MYNVIIKLGYAKAMVCTKHEMTAIHYQVVRNAPEVFGNTEHLWYSAAGGQHHHKLEKCNCTHIMRNAACMPRIPAFPSRLQIERKKWRLNVNALISSYPVTLLVGSLKSVMITIGTSYLIVDHNLLLEYIAMFGVRWDERETATMEGEKINKAKIWSCW